MTNDPVAFLEHPPSTDFERYVHFSLVGDELEHFENHLFECTSCQDQLSSLYSALDGQDDQWPELEEGDVLENRFKIVDRLGEGGLSFVFLAKDIESQLQRVLKFPKRTYCARFPVAEEHQFLSRLDHQCIVKPIALEVYRKVEFLVLQKIDGESLSALQPSTLLDEVELVRQLTDAMAHAHSKNIYHLDLHPENIIIQSNTRLPCIIDFGIAAHRDAPYRIGVGTEGYMSPERLSGQQCDARADVWSLGVILYMRLAYRHPFEQSKDVSGTPKPLTSLRHEVSSQLSRLCEKCLSPDPSARPADAGQLLKELNETPEVKGKQNPIPIYVIAIAALSVCLVGFLIYTSRNSGGVPVIQNGSPQQEWKVVSEFPEEISPGDYVEVQLSKGNPLAIEETINVPSGAHLKISGAGQIRFSENAGILATGKIEIDGQKNDKISLLPASESGTWRGLLLAGLDCNGSVFRNIEIVSGRGWGCMYSDPALYKGSTYKPPRLEIIEDAPSIGGALTIGNCENIKVISCLFRNNRSTRGGALCAVDVFGLWLHDSVFEHNTAGKVWDESTRPKGNSPGGAVFAQNCHDLSIKGCEFVENSARDKFSCGGAIYLGFNCNAKISDDSLFERNYAQYVGGAVYALRIKPKVVDTSQSPDISGKSFVELVSCDFISNMAGTEFSGGAGDGTAIYINDGYSADVIDCTFRDECSSQALVSAEGQEDNPCRLDLKRSEFFVGKNWGTLESCCSSPNQETHDDIGIEATVTISDPVIRQFSLQKGFEERAFGRFIDTVVIHHASAIRWDSENRAPFDRQFKEDFYQGLSPELRSLQPQERTFRPEFVIGIFNAYGVASHYMISRDGEIIRLVAEKDVAFHAGKSIMPQSFDELARGGVNEFSLGIELIGTHPSDDPRVTSPIGFDTSDSTPAYTYSQYHGLAWLLADIERRSRIRFVVGHDEITGHRNSPKTDPGELFDWDRIRDQETGSPVSR